MEEGEEEIETAEQKSIREGKGGFVPMSNLEFEKKFAGEE